MGAKSKVSFVAVFTSEWNHKKCSEALFINISPAWLMQTLTVASRPKATFAEMQEFYKDS